MLNFMQEGRSCFSGTILGFDFGTQRIGIAVGSTEVRIAHPLKTIASPVVALYFSQIADLIKLWQPVRLLVGLPYSLAGHESDMSRSARRFARRLQGRFATSVIMWEERLSSAAAAQSLSETGIKGISQRAILDQVAAQHILQHYLDTPNSDHLLILP